MIIQKIKSYMTKDDVIPVIHYKTDVDCNELHLYPLGDIHIGSAQSDIKSINKWINKIANDDKAAVILLGDLIDNGIDIGKYEQNIMVEDQIEKVVNILSPIKNKIIGMVSGNHEERTSKNSGTDISKRIALELGVADVYSRSQCAISIRVGNDKGRGNGVLYNIFFTHGNGGGRTIGSITSKMFKLKDIVCDADIYVQGHVHRAISIQKPDGLSFSRGQMIRHDQLFVSQGAWLKYGGYASRALYDICDERQVIITLDGTKKSTPSFVIIDPENL